MKFTNKVYDVLKYIVLIVLPATATLYTVLAGIWGFPFADAVSQTLAAIATFLGVLLGISTVNYNKAPKKNSIKG